jgi:predicted MFS family arabinose efflux permease
MNNSALHRNVVLLAICQALQMTGLSIMIIVSALTGQMLASNDALSTLPLGLQFTAATMTTFPASFLMKRLGRRIGFSVGAMATVIGAGIMAVAVLRHDFLMFCAGNALIGVGAAFVQFYRFAAADMADEAFRGKAISLVLAGGVVAAICGAPLARWSRTLLDPAQFAGCFIVIIALGVAAFLVMQWITIPRPTEAERKSSGRPLIDILRQPVVIVAILGGMIGYGVMVLVMTATPLAMLGHHHHFEDSAFVIQWHALGMFVPSFFTGALIARFGVLNVMLAGAALLAGCVAINLLGTDVVEFWAALVLLGIGWNFLYIGASTLLTAGYQPAERAKVQASNDFMVGIAVAASSFSSGALYSHFGWQSVNYGVIPLIGVSLIATGWLIHQRRVAVAVAPSA